MSKQSGSKPLSPEWSHRVDVTELSDPVELHIEASEEEAKDVARRLSLSSLNNLKADLKMARERGHVIKVDGRFEADIVQPCAVTLQPVESRVEDSFEAWFSDEDQAVSLSRERRARESGKGHVVLPIVEESENPEPVIQGHIDLGELVTQYLSLAIDPYPHAEGVDSDQLEEHISLKQAGNRKRNPFEALKALKTGAEKEK